MPNPLQRGFTLLDLLVTLALLALLATLAVPNFTTLIESNRQHTLLDELRDTLHGARTQAILEGRTLEVCPYTEALQCGTDWNKGWILRATRAQEPLRTRKSAHTPDTLLWSGYTGTVRFLPNGTSPTSNGRFILCGTEGPVGQLVINRQGRVRTATLRENQNERQRCP